MTPATMPLAAVVAFETWTQSLHRHRKPEGAAATLAPDVFVGTFPSDLSEVLFAVRSLRRHLADRGWASGRMELSALDAIAQVALRAPAREWRVVIRRGAARTEVATVSESLHRLLTDAERGLSEEQLHAASPEDRDLAFARGWIHGTNNRRD